jgi:hypothetical protein
MFDKAEEKHRAIEYEFDYHPVSTDHFAVLDGCNANNGSTAAFCDFRERCAVVGQNCLHWGASFGVKEIKVLEITD